jgi:UDP-N-acetylglucosamine 2-epimerase (non-hydrolysing)
MAETKSYRILAVVGARPNYVKAAAILEAARGSRLSVELADTGQHRDPELSSSFARDLGIEPPRHRLGVEGKSALERLGGMLVALERVVERARPDAVLALGDVDSAFAAALVANRLGVRLVHVEAGLRSHDPEMPEEWNRRAIDLVADLALCTEASGVAALLAEGKRADQVFLVGNVMIDTLAGVLERARAAGTAARLGLDGAFGVLTLHRPSNVDDPARLRSLLEGAVLPLARELPLVFPVHPRTRPGVEAALEGRSPPGVTLAPPLGYLEFVSLLSDSHARLVLTDSGGVQEETTFLGVPCLTLRKNTERPVTVELGTNRLAGTDPAAILEAARASLRAPRRVPKESPPLWDGRAGARTVAIIEAWLDGGGEAAIVAARAAGAKPGREGLAARPSRVAAP